MEEVLQICRVTFRCMRICSSLVLCVVLTACSPADGRRIGLMPIRCSGVSATPSRVAGMVEEEWGSHTDHRICRLDGSRSTIPAGLLPVQPEAMRRAGRATRMDLILGGQVERLADRLLIGWRLVDVRDPKGNWQVVEDHPWSAADLDLRIRTSLQRIIRQWSEDPGDRRAGVKDGMVQPDR